MVALLCRKFAFRTEALQVLSKKQDIEPAQRLCGVYWQVVVDTADKPGVRDRANFDLHWSVDYWQNFTLPPAIEDSGTGPIPSR